MSDNDIKIDHTEKGDAKTDAPSTDGILSFLNNNENASGKLPPVEDWHPENCGEMDLVIRTNGEWRHEGTPIGRKKLVRLFSTVLRKDDDQHFLVTPAEKIAIQVEWQPFVIIDYEIVKQEGSDVFVFVDNCDNQIALTELQQLAYSTFEQQELPIINVRRNLYASFSRSCYYRLIELAQMVKNKGKTKIVINSNNIDFVLGIVEEEAEQ